MTDEASAIGAVNTVHVHDGRTTGYNTDGAGFLQPLQSLGTPLDQLTACVLGAGGAARALAAALLNAGCPRLVIANRTQARSERLAAELQKRFAAAEVRAVPMADAADAAQQSRLIVNATSLGMHAGDAPLLPGRCFAPEQIAYDIVYRPLNTPFLQAARAAGATTIGGLDMLIGQGAAAFTIWTGLAFPWRRCARRSKPASHKVHRQPMPTFTYTVRTPPAPCSAARSTPPTVARPPWRCGNANSSSRRCAPGPGT